MKKIFYFSISLIRYILNLPFVALIAIGNIYAKFLKIIDQRNHSNFWPEILSKNIDKSKSKIFISKDKQKFIEFYTPTKVAGYRVKTFFKKEPETIEWMDRLGKKDAIFFDIGSNMGGYSIYFAKKFDAKVFSFEPSYKNLELMIKNLKINKLQNNISVIPNPLCDNFRFSKFIQNDFVAGQAKASFLLNQKEKDEFSAYFNDKSTEVIYDTLGLSLDNLFDIGVIPKPNLIKIDVDGNEAKILSGAKKILQNATQLSLLIEIRDQTENLISSELSNLGFKKILSIRDNQIWEK